MVELKHVIYTSTASEIFKIEDLKNILIQARDLNLKFNITGFLIYKKGHFLQVIEGPVEHIDQLMLNIEKDTRHYGVIRMIDEVIESRCFSDWSMAFKYLDKDGMPGFSDVLNSGEISEDFELNIVKGKAKTILEGFIKRPL